MKQVERYISKIVKKAAPSSCFPTEKLNGRQKLLKPALLELCEPKVYNNQVYIEWRKW